MNKKSLFDSVSVECSKLTTLSYSTSFSLGIKMLSKKHQKAIYAVYGYVRFADEIVDTFHDFDKRRLLEKFKNDTIEAIAEKISLNPIINAFQQVYHEYNMTWDLVDTFLKSMEMDLEEIQYNEQNYEEYILGSAQVVGLMCLKVFTNGNQEMYDRLTPSAMRLGSAFQKINFLRDLNADYRDLGRVYFPNVDMNEFNWETKRKIESEIAQDFAIAYQGILQLPKDSRYGVYLAYTYYLRLFDKIKGLDPEVVLNNRIRIANPKKLALMFGSFLKHNFNML
jgi:phytoene/squalene synthetase